MDKEGFQVLIQKLLVVQERDTNIARCQRELDDLPAQKQSAQASLHQQSAALDHAREQLRNRQVAVKQLETDIETRRQQVAKLREQQFQIKTNVEFKTLGREIDTALEAIRDIEDRELELMEQVEQARRDITRAEEAGALAQRDVQRQLQELDTRRQALESELEALRRERADLAAPLDQAWLARYTRVMENRKDAALVGVVANTCGGCHMKLMPHVLQDIKRGDTIVSCTFCGRLLYWSA